MNNLIFNFDQTDNFNQILPPQGKVVFTNGCFDLIHSGHIEIFKYCKTLGNFLVVGLNSDESVTRLKGSQRPIVDQQQRALIVASIRYVDVVVIFSESTPYNLIKTIQPDVLVKGGDYQISQVVGHDLVEKTIIFPLIENQGTSNIIENIIHRYCKKEN
jgi:rfaE bifunctional protein nucleotidyltransferase chain/domain